MWLRVQIYPAIVTKFTYIPGTLMSNCMQNDRFLPKNNYILKLKANSVSIMLVLRFTNCRIVNKSLEIHEYLIHEHLNIPFCRCIHVMHFLVRFRWLIPMKTFQFYFFFCLCANNYRLFDPTEWVRNGFLPQPWISHGKCTEWTE